jgi:hypothetical protein
VFLIEKKLKLKVMPMTKLIAARYLVENEITPLAIDSKSPDQEVVQIKIWKRPKLDNLVHNVFLRRAKEFSSIGNPAIVPLIDYGFDGQNSCYFVAYQMSGGTSTTRLSYLIKQSPIPIKQTLMILVGVADALTHLHLNNFYGGCFDATDILLGGDPQQPNVTVNMAGIEGFEILLGIDKQHEEIDEQNFVEEDITQLAFLAANLVTGQPNPSVSLIKEIISSNSIPYSFKELLTRALLGGAKRYSSVSELKRDLFKALSEIHSETAYYMVPTKAVAQKLLSWGFIDKPELYIAVSFLNQEFAGETFAHVFELQQNGTHSSIETVRYSFTTQRFRMSCAPAHDAATRNLAIISIDCPSPTSLVTEREIGMAVTATIRIALQQNLPSDANILPLLDGLHDFRLTALRHKQREMGEKNGLVAWKKVLELQKRMLDQFQLPYTDWNVVDDGNTLLVDLKEELDSLDISEDERLMMSSSAGHRSTPVGYFQELDGKNLKISLAGDVNIDEIAKHGSITRDNLQVKSILHRQEDGLRRLRFKESVNPDLVNLLLDPTELKFDKIVNPIYWDSGLDNNQKEAVRKALEAKDIFLVHGPPGTGKTRTIVEIIRQIINTPDEKEQKILVTSQSNVAVNHALASLLVQQPGLRESVVRVGREEKAGETLDLLLDQQMQKWAEQVKARSNEFIEKKRREFDIKPQLAECVSMIDECERIRKDIISAQQELGERSSQYEDANKDVDALNELIAKLQSLRTETSGLLEKIGHQDVKFRSILDRFDNNYLVWASEFLKQANELSKLSAKRINLKDQLDSLQQTAERLQDNLKAGTVLIHKTLQQMFKQDLPSLEEQKSFVREKLAAQEDKALKLGRMQKISQGWIQRISRGISEFEGAYLNRCKVVGATCIGVAAKGDVSDMEFDWVIVDEAGRSTHPELIVPLVRGRKIVLVGDHRQLPPIIDKDLTAELLEEIEVAMKDLETSLFKELIEPAGKKPPLTQISLQTQYRMSPAIGNLISKCFYNNQLRHANDVRTIYHGQKWVQTPVMWIATNKVKNHIEHKVGYSYQNIAEAELTKSILDRMEADLASQNLRRSLGIIAGYMGQKRLLRQQIGRDLTRWPHLDIEINTVDAYQGQEKDYIIYSVVRSNTEHRIGFLQDERRLNVALSRAREFLVIVGDTETAEFAKTGSQDNPFYRVINHIRENRSECTIKDYDL